MNKDIKVIFMGTPHFGKVVLERLNKEYNVVLVVTQPDSFNRRGKLIKEEVKEYATQEGLNILQPEKLKDVVEVLKSYNPDFIVTAAYGKFLPQRVIDIPKYKVLNVHGSYLPKYRGSAPIQRAIMNDDESLGVTIMETVLKMDAGRMYKRELIKLEDNDTTKSMMDKLAHLGSDLLVEVIDDIAGSASITPLEQDEKEVTLTSMISKEEELLDFNLNARFLFNKIRAFYDNPLTYFIKDGLMYKVHSAEFIKDDSNKDAGIILENNKKLVIKCGKDALSIKIIQPSGKNPMDIISFLNGRKENFKIGDKISE